MTTPNRRTLPVLMAGAFGLSGAVACAAEPTAQELMQQIEQLQSKVAQIQANEVMASNAASVDATVESVLQNADRRSQLLADRPYSYGHSNGKFGLSSEDGSFVLNPGIQIQIRNVTNFGEDDDGDDDIEHGFEIRRAKLELTGNAFTKNFKYAFTMAAERHGEDTVTDVDMDNDTSSTDEILGGAFLLEDAWVSYVFADEWTVRAGQFKDPVAHEELTSSKRQMAVERSMFNERLLGGMTDRVQGVSLIYGSYSANNPINAEVALHDGIGSSNTDFADTETDYGIAGRVEYKIDGDWKSYQDFTTKGNKDGVFVVGAGGDFSAGGDAKIITLTADAQYETGPWSFYGAVALVDADFGGDSADGTNYGILGQVAYLLNPQWEVFGRYNMVMVDDDFEVNGEDNFHEITGGVNYYLGEDGRWGHRAKISADLTIAPNGNQGGSGVGARGGDDNEVIARVQFQLLL